MKRQFLSLTAICITTLNCLAQAPLKADAGPDTGYCPNDSVTIGGNPSATGGTPPYTYSWNPAAGLDNPVASNPKAFPPSPSTYVLTVTDALGNTTSDAVYVTNYTAPPVSAGPDETILQGTNIALQASGAVNYWWVSSQPVYLPNSANAVAEPSVTAQYCVVGFSANGCDSTDCMTVFVIPSDTIIIYNAFTPNSDGYNDFFHIGNLGKFPQNKLAVYTRLGKLVYQASPYENNWDGKVESEELPSATYYYIFEKGDGSKPFRGAITIIR